MKLLKTTTLLIGALYSIVLLFSFTRKSSASFVEISNSSSKTLMIDSFHIFSNDKIIESKMLFKNLYIGKNEVVLFDNDTLKRKIHGVKDAIYFQLYYHDINQKKFIQKKIDKNLYLRIAKIKIK